MRYLAIKVFIADPEFHCADALTMLHDARLLHFQTLRWEVGQLLNCVMALTTADEQEVVQRLALAVPEEYEEPSTMPLWRLLAHRDLLVHIPSPYRLPEVQVLIERAAKLAGLYSQRPQIDSCGGWVRPPVTHEQMATLSDAGLRRLLAHYPTNSGGADFWERFNADGPVGGPSAVRQQVCEFASRWPYRCMAFLDESGTSLEHSYRTAMLEGIATHLRHRFGNLHSAQGWRAIEEPDGVDLARWLVQHVTRDLGAFVQGGEVGELVLGAAAVLISDGDIDDLTPLLARGMQAEDPTPGRVDKSDPLIIGLNSVRGRVAEAALTVANRRLTAQHSIPTALAQVLHLCASDPHPAVRAILLRLLPYAISRAPELGWELFERATNTMGAVAWAQTYNCLYYHYKRDTEIVARHLARLHATGDGSALGVWSRISALRTLAGLVVLETYLEDLCALGSEEAWTGAADVFTANIASTHLRRTCERGLLAALGSDSANDSLLSEVSHLFRIRDQTSVQNICPIAVVEAYADALKARGSEQGRKVFGVGEWLAATAMEDPDYATTAIEAFLRGHVRLEAWDGSPYAQLLTTLFREAEERELSDQGQLLARVIAVQDALLSFDMTSLDGWLRAAERP